MKNGLLVGAILVSLSSNIFYSEKTFAHATPAYSHETTVGYSNLNWMASIPDDSKLSTLSLPGTHDTMSFYGGDVVQTQSMSLDTQLKSGIRVLDIRCKPINNVFFIYHGIAYQYANFDDVLRTVTTFLQNNPTETVLLKIGKEGEGENSNQTFEQIYQVYRNKSEYKSYFWNPDSSNPTLKDVRGKIVVLYNGSDFGDSSVTYNRDIGINFQSESQIKKQDNYVLGTNWGLYDKWIAVKNHINAASAGKPEHFYINYLSGSTGVFPYFVASGHINGGTSADNLLTGALSDAENKQWPDFPRVACIGTTCSIAFEGTNVLTYQRLANKHLRVGIIMADFPGAGLIDRIIKLNKCSP